MGNSVCTEIKLSIALGFEGIVSVFVCDHRRSLPCSAAGLSCVRVLIGLSVCPWLAYKISLINR